MPPADVILVDAAGVVLRNLGRLPGPFSVVDAMIPSPDNPGAWILCTYARAQRLRGLRVWLGAVVLDPAASSGIAQIVGPMVLVMR